MLCVQLSVWFDRLSTGRLIGSIFQCLNNKTVVPAVRFIALIITDHVRQFTIDFLNTKDGGIKFVHNSLHDTYNQKFHFRV